jgi:hypothetical protein
LTRKVAIFTEGQSELIFVRYLIQRLFEVGKVNFQCIKLISGNTRNVPYSRTYPNADLFILIVNVENDSRVLSAIKEREVALFKQGYEAILGLRDMYCEEYCEFADNIDERVNKRMIEYHQSTINRMRNSERIFLFFEIMEFESWLLSMYNLFRKIDERLSVEYIQEVVGYNLREIRPEEYFFHPANDIAHILNLIGFHYDKSEGQMEGIISRIDDNDILEANENGRCRSFEIFLDKFGEFAS